MEDYKTEYEKEELLAMLPNATSAQVVEVEDVTVVNVNNGTNSTNSTTGGQPATTATVVNQGARLGMLNASLILIQY